LFDFRERALAFSTGAGPTSSLSRYQLLVRYEPDSGGPVPHWHALPADYQGPQCALGPRPRPAARCPSHPARGPRRIRRGARRPGRTMTGSIQYYDGERWRSLWWTSFSSSPSSCRTEARARTHTDTQTHTNAHTHRRAHAHSTLRTRKDRPSSTARPTAPTQRDHLVHRTGVHPEDTISHRRRSRPGTFVLVRRACM
jgi:hypothetical protein